MTDAEHFEKKHEQKELSETYDFVYLGNGPTATGDGPGWQVSAGLYLKCILCDYMMSVSPFKTNHCFCGALYIDADWGRLGSKLGDSKVEVYQAQQKRNI